MALVCFSSDRILTYVEGYFQIPISARHLPEFSKLLIAVISLKRVVKLNYAKFILILEEKNNQEIESLAFDDDPFNEVSFISNSTVSDNEDSSDDDENDDEFSRRTLSEVKNLDEEGLKKCSDWEELLFDRVKRRKTNQ